MGRHSLLDEWNAPTQHHVPSHSKPDRPDAEHTIIEECTAPAIHPVNSDGALIMVIVLTMSAVQGSESSAHKLAALLASDDAQSCLVLTDVHGDDGGCSLDNMGKPVRAV